MNTNLVNKVGEIGQDNLIARLIPAAMTFGIKVKAGEGMLKRGTLLGADSSGKYAVYGVTSAETQEFNGDGTTKKFTVTAKPATLTSVTVGDTAAAPTDYAYDAETGEITFGTAPAAGTKNIEVEYGVINTGDLSVGAILADDVDATGEADVTAVAYRCGNFNPDAVIAGEGYTLTDADIDALRKYDIIFTQML
ncbi:MAG: hypothetical protein IJK23_09925 [Clostridia bacterium]|nr:hypothetical protein [Clostridia bacterium]